MYPDEVQHLLPFYCFPVFVMRKSIFRRFCQIHSNFGFKSVLVVFSKFTIDGLK